MELTGELKDLYKILADANGGRLVTSEAEHFMLVPAGFEIRSLKEFQHADPPPKKRGTVKLQDVASFVNYFNRFKSKESLIFADPANLSVVGVLDYHAAGDGEADHCRHRATMTLQTTERWRKWKKSNAQPMPQEAFATFIDENLADIYKPDGSKFPTAAEMRDVSRELTATADVQFNQRTSLEDGSRKFTYNHTVTGKVGGGEMLVPTDFVIRVPIFMNQPEVEIVCRLRYRIQSGGLQMWFDMIRADEILRAEVDAAAGQVADGTQTNVLTGTPE